MTHASHHAAATAVAALRQAWAWSTTAPVPIRRTAPAPAPSPRALARRSALLQAERADRWRVVAERTKPTGDVAEPVNLALIDARAYTLDTVVDAAWIAASDVRRRPLLVYGAAWGSVRRDTFERATRYIRMVAPLTRPATAGELAELLTTATVRLRSALDLPDTARKLPHPCPACQYRGTLQADTSHPDRRMWTATCQRTDCGHTLPIGSFGPVDQVTRNTTAA